MENQNAKSFWSKPEGKTGLLFLIALGVGAYFALPIIITLLANAIYAGILGVVLLGMIYVAFDSKFRTLISYMYKGAMRSITGAFIQLNPIAILETYVQDMENSLNDMVKQISLLRGQMSSLKSTIDTNEAARQNNMKLADRAQRTGAAMQVTLMSRKSGRLEKSNMTLQGLYAKLEVLYRGLSKMQEVTSIVIEDTKDEVDVKKREQKAVSAGSSAVRSAMKILSGNPDQKFMFDKAMETLVDDIGAKVGEMEDFMRTSSKIISTIDLQNGVYDEEGMAELEQWQNDRASALLGDEKTILINKAQDSTQVLDLNARIEMKPKSNAKSNLLGLEERR